jgi:hypothetical protein
MSRQDTQGTVWSENQGGQNGNSFVGFVRNGSEVNERAVSYHHGSIRRMYVGGIDSLGENKNEESLHELSSETIVKEMTSSSIVNSSVSLEKTNQSAVKNVYDEVEKKIVVVKKDTQLEVGRARLI